LEITPIDKRYLISAAAGRVAVRVIRTDEEQMIAETVCRVLDLG
jgi:acetate kinase